MNKSSNKITYYDYQSDEHYNIKIKPGMPLYCSGILTGMSFDIHNPMIMYHGTFFMFLNVRMDAQRNWISKTIEDLSRQGSPLSTRQSIRSNGSFVNDQIIYPILIVFSLLKSW